MNCTAIPETLLESADRELFAQPENGDSCRGILKEFLNRRFRTQAFQLAQGNQAKAARWLGVSRMTMREKLILFGLHPVQETAPRDVTPRKK